MWSWERLLLMVLRPIKGALSIAFQVLKDKFKVFLIWVALFLGFPAKI